MSARTLPPRTEGRPGVAPLAAAAMLAGFCGSAVAAEKPLPPPAVVVVTRAVSACFSTLVRATGFLVPRATAVVMFNAPGFRITEVAAGEGDTVAAGQPLALLLPKEPPAGGAQPASSGLPLKATAAGLILRSAAKVGTVTTAAGAPLFTLAVDGEIELMADIPSLHVPELNPGQTARVRLDDGREFPGHVRLAPADINRTTQLGQARISLDGSPALRVGLFAKVSIDAQRACGVTVPRAALTHRSKGISVQLVKNGVVETRRVRLGILTDNDAQIDEGVAEGDLVVASAGTSLRDGDRVKPVTSDLQEVP